jgi:hypothetical protein
MLTNDPRGPYRKDAWRFFDRAIDHVCSAGVYIVYFLSFAASTLITASPQQLQALMELFRTWRH